MVVRKNTALCTSNSVSAKRLVVTLFDDEHLKYDVSLECAPKLSTKLMGDRSVAKALYRNRILTYHVK